MLIAIRNNDNLLKTLTDSIAMTNKNVEMMCTMMGKMLEQNQVLINSFLGGDGTQKAIK